MNQRIDNQKNALHINLTSRQQAAFYHQMMATWAADYSPADSIGSTMLVSWLRQLQNRFYSFKSKAASDSQFACDCQSACDCG
jgi:hypothetical protein